MRYRGARWGGVLLLLLCLGVSGCESSGPETPAKAQISEQQQLIDHAQLAVANLRSVSSPVSGPVNSYLARARGVLIFPDLLRAGFIFGAEGGTGVLLERTATGWSIPPSTFPAPDPSACRSGPKAGASCS
jgi:lipid-binding SYLF domain-containing protein